ncbi:unnamed protein product [Lampetra fluviatilis]
MLFQVLLVGAARGLGNQDMAEGKVHSAGLQQPFSPMVRDNDITICTAQMLHHALVGDKDDQDDNEDERESPEHRF